MGLGRRVPRGISYEVESKYSMRGIMQADKAITAEGAKQIDILYHAAGIALNRYHGWKGLRIERLVEVSMKTYDDCAASTDISMIELLWRETGIDLVREDCNQDWWDIPYLSSAKETDKEKLTDMQVWAMLQGERKWVPSQITAAILLSLHRKEKWGDDRLFRFFKEMQDVKDEFKSNPKKLKAECDRLTGFMIADDQDLRKGNAHKAH